MHSPYEVPRLSTTNASPSDVDVELIIIPVTPDGVPDTAARLGASLGGELKSALQSGEFNGKANETFVASGPAAGWRASRVLFIGAGTRVDNDSERLRRAAVSAAQAARTQKRQRVAWVDAEFGALSAAARVEIVAEAFAVANFDNGVHKRRHEPTFFVREVVICASGDADAASRAGSNIGESINGARALVNEPGNYLPPRVMAEKAAALGSVPGVTAEILDEKQIESLKMGLLLGVARGSSEPPRLLVLKYEPASAPKDKMLGLVGKGITFDTGGISIKPSDGMERMKDDMAGGASVVAAIRVIAQLGAPIRVVGVVPMTENMPGGKAIKPGDVLKSAEGKTVEVINTDAEGRLILGDGLWYARRLGATHLVDVATLTGAIVTALGKLTSGLFGTPQPWVDLVRRVADRAGDRMWPMPLFDDYFDQIKSEIADIANTGGRPAGSVTAALFLRE